MVSVDVKPHVSFRSLRREAFTSSSSMGGDVHSLMSFQHGYVCLMLNRSFKDQMLTFLLCHSNLCRFAVCSGDCRAGQSGGLWGRFVPRPAGKTSVFHHWPQRSPWTYHRWHSRWAFLKVLFLWVYRCPCKEVYVAIMLQQWESENKNKTHLEQGLLPGRYICFLAFIT